MATAAPLLRETISALSVLDGARLEQLCGEAEVLAQTSPQEPVRDAVEVRALQQTLMELLRTTDANLRLLRELRALRVSGVGSDAEPGGVRWVR
jgi:hypothetical protein